jgi:glutamate-1-semialdehyde 2,1-aminomutase
MGTGNGNPVVAAVGTSTLQAIADGTAIAQADAAALRLRALLNGVLREEGLAWAAYGQHSGLHLFMNPLGRGDVDKFDAHSSPAAELRARSAPLINILRVTAQAHGLDLNAWPGALTSAAHDEDAIGRAAVSFASTVRALKRAGLALTGWGQA